MNVILVPELIRNFHRIVNRTAWILDSCEKGELQDDARISNCTEYYEDLLRKIKEGIISTGDRGEDVVLSLKCIVETLKTAKENEGKEREITVPASALYFIAGVFL